MEYDEFLEQYIKPFVKSHDKPFNRQLFNDTLDMLIKDGTLIEEAVKDLAGSRQQVTWSMRCLKGLKQWQEVY